MKQSKAFYVVSTHAEDCEIIETLVHVQPKNIDTAVFWRAFMLWPDTCDIWAAYRLATAEDLATFKA